MKLGRTCVSKGFGTTAFVVSPIALLGGGLIAIAVGHDVIHFFGEAPIALGLCAPAAYLLVRRLLKAGSPSPLSDLSPAE